MSHILLLFYNSLLGIKVVGLVLHVLVHSQCIFWRGLNLITLMIANWKLVYQMRPLLLLLVVLVVLHVVLVLEHVGDWLQLGGSKTLHLIICLIFPAKKLRQRQVARLQARVVIHIHNVGREIAPNALELDALPRAHVASEIFDLAHARCALVGDIRIWRLVQLARHRRLSCLLLGVLLDAWLDWARGLEELVVVEVVVEILLSGALHFLVEPL